MKKTLLIVNPCAGKLKARGSLFDIITILSDAGHRVTVELTKYAAHATAIARERAREYDVIVCAGGDGTLNEVVTGVLESGARITIGYIPAGSTNDFGTTLGISKNVKKSSQSVANGVEKQLDVGLLGGRHFTYVASFGAFTSTSYKTPQNMKNALGHLAYVLQGISDIPSIRAENIRIETDKGILHEGSYIFGAISNTTSVGGVISIDERIVTMNDGIHELLLVKAPKNIADLNHCISAIISQKYDSPMIEFDSLSSGSITSENPIVWSLDGERAEFGNKTEFINLNRAITMILPRSAAVSPLLSGEEGESEE